MKTKNREITQSDVLKMQNVLNSIKYLKPNEDFYKERFNIIRSNSIDYTFFNRAAIKLGYFKEKGKIGIAQYYECQKVGNFEPLEARKMIELIRQYQREVKAISVSKLKHKIKAKPKQVNIKNVTIDSKKEVSFLWGLIKLKY